MPVHVLIFFSCVISASIIGLILLKQGFRQHIPYGKNLLYLLIIGPVTLTNIFSYFYAFKNTSIANAVLTHYIAPVIVAFVAPIFLKEKLTTKVLLAVTVATAGLWIMLDISVSQFLDLLIAGDKDTRGIFAGIFSGFAYAALIIVVRIFAQNFNPLVMTFFQNIVIAIILLPFVKIPADFSSALWAFAVMGIAHSTIAPILYFRGMREVTANRAAILGYLEPVSAILLSVLFLAELVNYKIVVGGSMILFSGYITIKSSK